MFLFIILGLVLILAPFFSAQLKEKSKTTKMIVYTSFFVIGIVFSNIGANSIYEKYFVVYPSVEIENYAKERFDLYNSVKEKYEGEDVINIEKESTYMSCDEDYCGENSDKNLFVGADLDTNKMVTYQELYVLIKNFDVNNDGLLNFPEAKIKTVFNETKMAEVTIFNNAYPTVYGKRWPKTSK